MGMCVCARVCIIFFGLANAMPIFYLLRVRTRADPNKFFTAGYVRARVCVFVFF